MTLDRWVGVLWGLMEGWMDGGGTDRGRRRRRRRLLSASCRLRVTGTGTVGRGLAGVPSLALKLRLYFGAQSQAALLEVTSAPKRGPFSTRGFSVSSGEKSASGPEFLLRVLKPSTEK